MKKTYKAIISCGFCSAILISSVSCSSSKNTNDDKSDKTKSKASITIEKEEKDSSKKESENAIVENYTANSALQSFITALATGNREDMMYTWAPKEFWEYLSKVYKCNEEEVFLKIFLKSYKNKNPHLRVFVYFQPIPRSISCIF